MYDYAHYHRKPKKRSRSKHHKRTIDDTLVHWEAKLEKFLVERFPTLMYYLAYFPEKPIRFGRKRIW